MRILHLCLACFYIDDYSYQENLLPKFHKRIGHDVKIIASTVSFDGVGKLISHNKYSNYVSSDNINVVRLPYFFNNKIARLLRFYKGLYAEIEAFQPDVIFIHGGQFLDLYTVKRYFLKNQNIDIYIDNHADEINSVKGFLSKNILHKIIWKTVIKKFSKYVKKFYGVSEGRSQFLVDYYDISPEKVFTLQMGVDDDFVDKVYDKAALRKKLNIEEEDFVFITGGKFDRLKNIDILIESFSTLDQKYKLIVFGVFDSETKYLLDNLPSNIIFVGWKGQEEIFDLLSISNCAIFLGTHSVLWEQILGFGLPAIFKYWKGFEHLYQYDSVITLNDMSKSDVILEMKNMINNYDLLNKCAEINKKQFSYKEIAVKSIEI
ncbi:glycosyltransferase family 4 protein [Myroides sp. C8-3]|uniref:glycosyltransferase family 4 protein n=1 Tax=Myroides sp. C8-3 TaxID=3400533 RepID=UPI003D2F5E97